LSHPALPAAASPQALGAVLGATVSEGHQTTEECPKEGHEGGGGSGGEGV